MASLISDTEPPSHPHSSSTNLLRRKKRLSESSSSSVTAGDGDSHARWRSEKQQRKYSAKLIQALRQVRLGSSSSAATPSPTPQKRGKAIREAADRALAVSARGRTLWSRAILANRIKLKFRKQKRPRPAAIQAVITAGSIRSGRSKKRRVTVVRLNKKSIPTVNRKVRVLGRLVPGCRKESVPVILEEATVGDGPSPLYKAHRMKKPTRRLNPTGFTVSRKTGRAKYTANTRVKQGRKGRLNPHCRKETLHLAGRLSRKGHDGSTGRLVQVSDKDERDVLTRAASKAQLETKAQEEISELGRTV